MRLSPIAASVLLGLLGGACVHDGPPHHAQPEVARVAPDVRGKTKLEKIRRLLELTGSDAVSRKIMDNQMAQFEMMPNLPPGFARKFRELAMQEDLIALVVPVYDKHFRENEIDAAIVFYESPEGRNMVRELPAITQEQMMIGQQWALSLATRTMKALQEQQDSERNTQ